MLVLEKEVNTAGVPLNRNERSADSSVIFLPRIYLYPLLSYSVYLCLNLCYKSIFQPVFGVGSTQMLVKIYIKDNKSLTLHGAVFYFELGSTSTGS